MPRYPLLSRINDIGPAHPVVPVRQTTDEEPQLRKRRDKDRRDQRKDPPSAREPLPDGGVDEYV